MPPNPASQVHAVLDGDFTHDGFPGIRLLISPGIVYR
jgi:hypothetical protein